MPVTALTSTSVEAPVGDQWVITVLVTTPDNVVAAQAPVVTVTEPGGTTATPTVEALTAGVYRATRTLAAAGRYVAVAAATVTQVGDYLKPHSWTDAQVLEAYEAEVAAQRRVCRIPADYDADLAQALKRRVPVNLAKRRIPLAVLQGDAEAGTPGSSVPVSDPEINRLEKPYRRWLAR